MSDKIGCFILGAIAVPGALQAAIFIDPRAGYWLGTHICLYSLWVWRIISPAQ